MAQIIKSDCYEGSTLVREGSIIREIMRPVIVQLNPLADGGVAAMVAAVSVSGMPEMWSQHPIYSELRLISMAAEGIAANMVRVMLRYVNSAATLFDGASYLETVETTKNLDGSDVVVKHVSYVDGAGDPVRVEKQNQRQYALISRDVPRAFFGVRRIEPTVAYGGNDPIAVQRAFTGKLNAQPFFGYAPETVRCDAIKFTNEGLGYAALQYSYEFSVRFQAHALMTDQQVWRTEALWVNPKTGAPGPDLVRGTGVVEVINYSTIDFNILGLGA